MEECEELQVLNIPPGSVDNYVDGGQSEVTDYMLEELGKLQFKESLKSVSKRNHPRSVNRFHPKFPVLASGVNREVILFSAADGSIPFRYWKESQFKLLKRQTWTEFSYFAAIEWNVHGTQLAAGDDSGGVTVWSYPEGEILFEAKKHTAHSVVGDIQFNPFRHDVLSTWNIYEKKLLLWNSSSETNLFYEFEYEIEIRGVAWISESQIALLFKTGLIEIYEIDESQPTAKTRVVKRLQHDTKSDTTGGIQWSDKTKHLATCSRDGTIKVWSLASDQPIHSLKCPSACWLGCFAMILPQSGNKDNDGALPENLTLACGLEDGSIVIWSPLTKIEQLRHRILKCGVENDVIVDSLAFSQDGRLLASLIRDEDGNQLIIWSTTTWIPVYTNKIHVYYPYWLSWLMTELSSGVYYKLVVPQYVKRQEEIFVHELVSTANDFPCLN